MAFSDDDLSVDSSDEKSGIASEEMPTYNHPVEKRNLGYDKYAWENLPTTNEDENEEQEGLPIEGDATHIGQMDLRVGLISRVYPHQADDSLYIEEIELGSYDEYRLFATTLGPRYPNKKDLVNKKVVVLCNVHPIDTREIGSKSGMMLVASQYTEGKGTVLEVCEVTEGEPGDRVYVEGFPKEPFPNSDEDIFHFILPDLRVDNEGMVLYKDLPLKVENTAKGEVYTKSFSNCKVILD